MSKNTLYRASRADLEIRSDGDGRRTVTGIAAPFDEEAKIGDGYTEILRRGAFAKTIRERGPKVKFLVNHDRTAIPIGHATLLREDTSGLYGEFLVRQSEDGDKALEAIKAGDLDGLSIGFQPVESGDKWNRRRDHVERTEVILKEVSAVGFPSFAGAEILAVRSDGTRPGLAADVARNRLRILELN